MVNNYTNNIPVNTTYLNNKNLKKENRENFGFIVLHDGGDIPGCAKKYPEDIENCVVRNIINGSWKNSGLSTHYYIGCSGEIFKLVSEDYIAYHAGCKSSYCVLKGMNNISLGIDLRNCHRYNENKNPYTEEQHNSLNLLLQDLKNRGLITTINDEMVIAHFEVLTYKNDPLPGFNWLDITGLTMDHRLLRDSKQETPFQKALKKNLVNPNLA
jgi:N-acetyl-anhydromuramyl-L-alanine amidase AmpD